MERLQELKHDYPRLGWTTKSEISSDELITLVIEQIVDYTVYQFQRSELAVETPVSPPN